MPIYIMTDVELWKLETINQLDDGKLTRAQRGVLLHLSVRRIKRLLDRYPHNGIDGLVPKKRGKPCIRALPRPF